MFLKIVFICSHYRYNLSKNISPLKAKLSKVSLIATVHLKAVIEIQDGRLLK